MSRNCTCISARPGTMLGAFGSIRMRPIVHTVRGPGDFGEAVVDARREPHHRGAGILAAAPPVVPAWFCSPVTVTQ